ncbi:MAG: hypothetical protein ACFE8Z_10305 [Candidatus Hermodarchaeota archaeon]
MEKKLPEPYWESEPLDAERPFLEQIEEKVLNAASEEDFAQDFEWLEKNYFQDAEKVSITTDRRHLTHIKALP